MSRRRHIASLVAGAFSAALTVLPWLHTWHHRDDHVHVDGAIVFLDHDHDHDHGDHDGDDDFDADADAPGFDHPEHHGAHARGALAHGAAFILAGAIFMLPPPAVALEQPAPPQTWAGGLSARHAVGPGVARAGLRFFGIGDRPASDDGVLVAQGFTEVDVHVGYRMRWFDLALGVENLLDREFRSAQFATTSRLRTEPAVGAPIPPGFSCGPGRMAPAPDGSTTSGRFYGCEDVDYTPAYPLTIRLMATLYLD